MTAAPTLPINTPDEVFVGELTESDFIDIDMAMHRFKQPLPGNPLVDGYEDARQKNAVAIELGMWRRS